MGVSGHVPATNFPICKGWAGDGNTGHEVDGSDEGDTNTFVIGATSWNFKVGLYASMKSDVASCTLQFTLTCRMHSLAPSLSLFPSPPPLSPPSLFLPPLLSFFLSTHAQTQAGSRGLVADLGGSVPVSSPMPTTSFSSRKKPQHHAPSSFSFQDEAKNSPLNTAHEKGASHHHTHTEEPLSLRETSSSHFDAQAQHTFEDFTMLSASPQVP